MLIGARGARFLFRTRTDSTVLYSTRPYLNSKAWENQHDVQNSKVQSRAIF